ncbi:MAG: tetraacyldisaccharide 4'-kinase [Pseudomonadota bacterium]
MATEHGGWLQRVWYGKAPGGFLLWPLEWLFRGLAALRRAAFRMGLADTRWVSAPVIVVGNISVGGSGKTPLVGWLGRAAREAGWQPAIVSRGYGGAQPLEPLAVTSETAAAVSGDEPLMLARDTGLPVFVSRDRYAAAAQAVARGADLVIADDGLQHYGLGRDAEVVVVDATHGHGNGHCLPAGPLREPVSRLAQADLVVRSNGEGGTSYRLAIAEAVNLETGERRPLTSFAGATVHVVAGIGHPARFHAALEAFGMTVQPIAVPDHGRLEASALSPDDASPVLMTAKDAVKYTALTARHWVVPARVDTDDDTAAALRGLLELARARFNERQGGSHE